MSAAAPERANSNKQLIDMFRRSRLFRDYEGVFTKATGLPLALRPLDYWQLEHQGKKNANPFDAILHYDHTRAVEPLERSAEWQPGEVEETFPSGL
jgi:hypothetical protein